MYKFLLVLLSAALESATLMKAPSLGETFRQCLVSYQPQNDLRRCFGVGAISRLQTLDSSPEFDFVDGLTLSRDISQEYRDNSYDYAGQDPSDFRSIINTFDQVFAKRVMRWDLNFIYPGLAMRILPSVGPSGILEFVMDSNQETAKAYNVQDIGTSKLLARQFIVPFLLGSKFNIATIVPLIFGLVVLLAKKIVFIGKIALIASSAVGLGSLLFKTGNAGSSGGYYATDHNYYGSHQPVTFGGHYKGYNEEFLPQDLQHRNVNVPKDELKVYENVQTSFGDRSTRENQQKKGRNFAWNDDDRVMKKVR